MSDRGMHRLGAHRGVPRNLRLLMALFLLVGLLTSIAAPSAVADPGGGDECAEMLGGGPGPLDDDCDEEEAAARVASPHGRLFLTVVRATCTIGPSGTRYVFNLRATRYLRSRIEMLRLVDLTDGRTLLSRIEPNIGRHLVLSGTVPTGVERIGLGFEDEDGYLIRFATTRDWGLRLVTAQCRTA